MSTANGMIPVISITADCLLLMSYKQMVDTYREIIRRWPDSKYGFGTKKALADLPERYHKMYNITKEELDLSSFYRWGQGLA
jgi:hypothetical protein